MSPRGDVSTLFLVQRALGSALSMETSSTLGFYLSQWSSIIPYSKSLHSRRYSAMPCHTTSACFRVPPHLSPVPHSFWSGQSLSHLYCSSPSAVLVINWLNDRHIPWSGALYTQGWGRYCKYWGSFVAYHLRFLLSEIDSRASWEVC